MVNCNEPANACAFGSRPQGQGMRHSPAACPGRVTEIPLVRQTNVDSVATKNRKNKRLEHWCFIAVRDLWLELACCEIVEHGTHGTWQFVRSCEKRQQTAARHCSSTATQQHSSSQQRAGRTPTRQTAGQQKRQNSSSGKRQEISAAADPVITHPGWQKARKFRLVLSARTAKTPKRKP